MWIYGHIEDERERREGRNHAQDVGRSSTLPADHDRFCATSAPFHGFQPTWTTYDIGPATAEGGEWNSETLFLAKETHRGRDGQLSRGTAREDSCNEDRGPNHHHS